jgi:hypothetical protein
MTSSRILLFVLLLVVGDSLHRPAFACPLCATYPETTAIDAITGSDVVILARENPDQPFLFKPVRVLKGSAPVPKIDLLVDATTQRMLSLNPGDAVVLVYRPKPKRPPLARLGGAQQAEAEKEGWLWIGYGKAEFISLVEFAIVHQRDWEGPDGRAARLAYFAPLLDSTVQEVAHVAYTEVARLPYSLIRTAAGSVSRTKLMSRLHDTFYVEWQSLYILLLGMTGEHSDAEFVRQQMAINLRFGISRNLSAWTTALAEIDGSAAIKWLEYNYFKAPGRSQEELLEIMKGLSASGAGRPDLREPIAASYALALETYPELVGWISKDLYNWKNWGFKHSVASALEKKPAIDEGSITLANLYVMRATQ